MISSALTVLTTPMTPTSVSSGLTLPLSCGVKQPIVLVKGTHFHIPDVQNQHVRNKIHYLPLLNFLNFVSCQLMAPSFTPSPSQKHASHPWLIPLTDEPSLPLKYSSDLLIFLILLPPPYAGPSSPLCVEYFIGQLTNLLAFWSPLDYPLSSSQRCVKHEYDHIIPFWEIVGSPLPTGQSTSSWAWHTHLSLL